MTTEGAWALIQRFPKEREFMVIVETSIFTRIIQELFNDEGYAEFQISLSQRPDMGDLMWPAQSPLENFQQR